MMQKKNKKILLATFLITISYYFFPVIQDRVYTNPTDRFNDYYLFWWPLNLYQSLQVIAHKTMIPIFGQSVVAIISWLLLYLIIYLISFCFKKK